MMANSMNYNGTDLGGASYGLTVARGSLSLAAAFRVDTTQIPRGDGALSPQTTYAPRIIPVSGFIAGSSFSDLKDKIDAIAEVLDTRQDAELYFDAQNDRYWNARPEGRPEIEVLAAHATFSMRFIAVDPFGYARGAASSASDTLTGGTGEPITATTTGSTDSFPVITIVQDASASQIVVEVEAVERRIEWNGSLVSGDTIKFDCDPNVQLVSKAVSGSDVFNADMADVSGIFLFLAANSANEMRFTGGSGLATITWRDRYL